MTTKYGELFNFVAFKLQDKNGNFKKSKDLKYTIKFCLSNTLDVEAVLHKLRQYFKVKNDCEVIFHSSAFIFDDETIEVNT